MRVDIQCGTVDHDDIRRNFFNKALVSLFESSELANDFDEAIRVALIRNKKPTEGRELRCPLPELHREMTLLRQDRNRIATAKLFREYPLVRFIVELKTLVQSEQNLTASRRFRLETAVIENTKNPKNSDVRSTGTMREKSARLSACAPPCTVAISAARMKKCVTVVMKYASTVAVA